jgi:hypothetical protein
VSELSSTIGAVLNKQVLPCLIALIRTAELDFVGQSPEDLAKALLQVKNSVLHFRRKPMLQKAFGDRKLRSWLFGS